MKRTIKGLLKKQLVIMLTVALALGQTPLSAFAAEVKTVSEPAVTGISAASENNSKAVPKSPDEISDNTVSIPVSVNVSSDEERREEPAAGAASGNSVSDDGVNGNNNSEEGPEKEVVSDNGVSENSVSENDFSLYPTGYIEVETPDPGRVSTDPYVQGEEAAGASYPAKFVPNDLPDTRNQNPHGTCWTYGTLAMVEGDLVRSGHATSSVDTSELHVAYFSNWYNKGVVDPLGGTEGDTTTFTGSDYLEAGGNYIMSVQPLANWTGAVDENSMPHAPEATTATKIDANKQYSIDEYHVQGIYSIPTAERDTMKKYIKNNGAVAVAYCSDERFYNSSTNAFYCNYAYQTNHAVSIVGWDDDFAASKFNVTPQGNGAWLVRNSWSTGSENSYMAYFWMSYYDKSLYNVSYAVDAEPASNYANNYQYDGDSIFSYTGEGGTGLVYGANIFETKANGANNERLDAVGFETYSTTNANYEIYVYRDIKSESDPESGTLCSVEQGRTTANGYYTVKLSNPVELKAGTKFGVVVKLSKNGEYVSIAQESSYMPMQGLKKTIKSNANESFYKTSESGSYTTTGTSGNIRIKAFTNNLNSSGEPVDPSSLLGIRLEASKTSLKIGQTMEITAKPLPAKAELGELTWDSSDKNVATVDQNGKVTALALGETLITAKSGNVTGKLTVEVDENKITSVTLDKTSLTLDEGDTFTLNATVIPRELSNNVEWSSLDESVATVDNGKIKAVKKGSTEIRVKAKDKGGLSAVCRLTVMGSDVTEEDAKAPEKSDVNLWAGLIKDCYYDGTALKPDINIYDGIRLLKNGKDYTVSYKNNKAAAKKDSAKAPTVTVTFKGNYSGKLTRTFNILPAPLSGNVIAGNMTEAYTGKKIKFTPVLVNSNSGVRLKEKTDFVFTTGTVSGGSAGDIINAGDYYIVIEAGTGGNYEGKITCTLSVLKNMTSVEGFKVKVKNTTYRDDPSEVKPVYTVTEGKNPVAKSKYKMSEPVIDDKGHAVVVMTGVPEYRTCGSKLVKFKVSRQRLDIYQNTQLTKECSAEFRSVEYEKGGPKPKIELCTKNGGEILEEGVDYKVIYQNNKCVTPSKICTADMPRVVVVGKGKYKGSAYATFTITKKSISKLPGVLVSDVSWSNKKNAYAKTKVVLFDSNGKKLGGSDVKFKVPKISSALEIGDTVPVDLVWGAGNYTGEIEDLSYRIIDPKKNISKSKVKIGNSISYTRKGISLTADDITVKLGGSPLDKDSYEIAATHANPGNSTGTVVIRGKGEYGGLKIQTFKINRKGVSK